MRESVPATRLAKMEVAQKTLFPIFFPKEMLSESTRGYSSEAAAERAAVRQVEHSPPCSLLDAAPSPSPGPKAPEKTERSLGKFILMIVIKGLIAPWSE